MSGRVLQPDPLQRILALLVSQERSGLKTVWEEEIAEYSAYECLLISSRSNTSSSYTPKDLR